MFVQQGLSAAEKARETILIAILILMAVMVLICLIRAVKGPRVADRIVAINMMGTMVIVMIAILAVLLKEGYLVDICLVYAMISFLAVIVISKVYLGVYVEQKTVREDDDDGDS